jgi:hypothetical protein
MLFYELTPSCLTVKQAIMNNPAEEQQIFLKQKIGH